MARVRVIGSRLYFFRMEGHRMRYALTQVGYCIAIRNFKCIRLNSNRYSPVMTRLITNRQPETRDQFSQTQIRA